MIKKIIIFLCLFFVCIDVKAIQMNDKVYSNEWIDDVYIIRDNRSTKYFEKARIIRRQSDNKVVYCLQPFVDINLSSVYTGYYDDYTKIDISKSNWEKIKKIAYFGYGYANHKSSEWYAITQIMIWRVVDNNSNFYFTDTLNGNKTTKYDSKINEINNLISNSYLLPSFANKKEVMSINDTMVLTDTNNVLKNYKIKDNNYSKIVGNSLEINTKNEEKITFNFERQFKNYDHKPLVMLSGNAQKIFTPGDLDNINFTYEISVKSGKIKVKKIDSVSNDVVSTGSGKLVGTKFGIYDASNNLLEEKTINDNYELEFDNLKFGNYYIKEIESMEGYYKNESKYSFTINELILSRELTISNDPIKEKIKIIKYLDNTSFEKGVVFEIYNDKEELIDTKTTNENGEIEIELYYGKYLVKQKNTTKNYIKADDFEIVVDNDSTNNIYKINDEMFSSYIRINKLDKKTNEKIDSNCVFDVYKNNDLIDEIVVNKEGISSKKLDAGEYYLIEKNAPKGYLINNSRINFTIDDENEFDVLDNNELVFNINVFNEKEPSLVIDVPDTSKNINYLNICFLVLLILLYRKKIII